MENGIRKLFSNLNIKQKIRFFSVSVALLLTLVMLWFTNAVVARSVTERSNNVTQENMQRIAAFLNRVDGALGTRMRYLENSISMREMLTMPENGGVTWSVEPLLRDVENTPYISAIDIFMPDGTHVAGTIGNQRDRSISKTALEQLMVFPRGRNLWRDDGLSRTINTEVLSVYRILASQEGRPLGVARMLVSTASLTDMYNYVGFNIASEIYLYSGRGNVILPKNGSLALSELGRDVLRSEASGEVVPEYLQASDGKYYYVTHLALPQYDMNLMGAILRDTLLAETQLVQSLLLLMGGAVIALELLASEWLARYVSRPIADLSDKMRRVRNGDLTLRMNSSGGDEIGVLAQSFDRMLDQLVGLMEEIESVQKRKRELELISLQTQITPHFLYNSLDSVSALVKMEDMELAYKISKALGMFYRGVLSDGRNVIRLEEELQIIRSYLQVQSMRYKDIFSYEIAVAPELLNIGIIKLTIQPLVENAIYHGIRNLRRHGLIQITGRVEQSVAVISVRDNGLGMLQQGSPVSESGVKGDFILHRKGFGMQNADQRLKLYFGKEYGLEIESAVDEGACIHIRLPNSPYEDETDDFSFNRG